MDWETWGLPLIILSAGLSVGIFLATRTRDTDASDRPEEDHTARKEALLEQIRELDADREKMDAAEYERRRDALIDDAAAAQRALARPAPAAAAARGPISLSRTGGWAALTLVFFVALGVLINQYAAPRADGGSMTGNGGELAELAAARQARLDAAQETLRTQPDDIAALNILTYDALLYRDLDTAMAQLDRARGIDSGNRDVIINLAILQMSVGMADRAEAALDGVLTASPGHGRALLWKGFMQANTERQAEAVATLQQASASLQWPEEKMFAENMIRELTAPPLAVRLTGSAALVGEATAASGTLYIYARRSEAGGGPPVAAFRHRGGLPVEFSLTDADMVMGGEWPEQVWLQARIDADGDPMTRDDTLAQSEVIGPLSSGTEGITLTLTPTDGVTTEDAPATTDAPVATGPRLSGTLSLQGGEGSGIVFVIVRRDGASGGPPVAAKRIEAASFPLDFTITDADMMLGGPWPEAVTISARLDGDGNAMTVTEGDRESLTVGPLTSGASGITLNLGEGGVARE